MTDIDKLVGQYQALVIEGRLAQRRYEALEAARNDAYNALASTTGAKHDALQAVLRALEPADVDIQLESK